MAQASRHPLAGKHIIVAGGGLSGLACVRSITRNWPEGEKEPTISVYERDPRELPSHRGDYSLGLRSDTGGLQALQTLGLIDDVFANRTPGTDVQPMIMRDVRWNTMLKVNPPAQPPDGLPTSDMRITRLDLRECLVRGIPDETDIHWDVICDSASRMEDGRMMVELSDGTTRECDFLIVSDGAGSRIRRSLLPDDKLNFAGAVLISGLAEFPSQEEVPEKIREGFGPVIGGDGHNLFIFQITPVSYVWFITRRSATLVDPAPANIVEQALSHGKVFGENFSKLVSASSSSAMRIWNAHDKPPIDHGKVLPDMPVAFIGDANHAVTPFAGNGANNAIIDGMLLGQLLCTTSSLSSAISAFDKECIPRCKKTLRISHIMIWAAHSKGWLFHCLLLFWRFLNYFIRP